jgi:threonine dehydratase
MRLVWQRMKIIIEPSSAVAVATLIGNRERYAGRRIGIILSGGNVDLENLPFPKS